MKIAVIGAGISGVTTAYQLSGQGHEVTVFERSSTVAENSSFAHLGQQSSLLHNHPRLLLQGQSQLRVFLNLYRTLKATPTFLLRHGAWLWRWSRKIDPTKTEALDLLASRGQAWIRQIGQPDSHIECETSTGLLVLFASEKHFSLWSHIFEQATKTSMRWQKVDAKAVTKIEPALHGDHAPFCHIHLPNEITGNCRQFAIALKQKASELGTVFQFGSRVDRIQPSANDQSVELKIADHANLLCFDKVIICTGSIPHELLGQTSIEKNVCSATSYTLSAPIRESLNAPAGCVLDTGSGIAIARLGNRIRVAGPTLLGKRPARDAKLHIAPLYQALERHFPNAALYSHGIQTWQGCKTYTSDHLPLIGPTHNARVWLNLAHGDIGWPLAAGAAQMIAESIDNANSVPALAAFSPLRFA